MVNELSALDSCCVRWPSVDDSRNVTSDADLQVWFALFFAGLGFLMPYFNVILQHDGYNGWQLGVISAVRPFVSAAASPVWAALADRYHIHRHIFLVAIAVTTLVRTAWLALVYLR